MDGIIAGVSVDAPDQAELRVGDEQSARVRQMRHAVEQTSGSECGDGFDGRGGAVGGVVEVYAVDGVVADDGEDVWVELGDAGELAVVAEIVHQRGVGIGGLRRVEGAQLVDFSGWLSESDEKVAILAYGDVLDPGAEGILVDGVQARGR